MILKIRCTSNAFGYTTAAYEPSIISYNNKKLRAVLVGCAGFTQSNYYSVTKDSMLRQQNYQPNAGQYRLPV